MVLANIMAMGTGGSSQCRCDPMSLKDVGLADKIGVAYSIGCGPRPTNGSSWIENLKLVEADLSIIK